MKFVWKRQFRICSLTNQDKILKTRFYWKRECMKIRKHMQTFHANKGFKLAIVFFILTSPFSKQNFVVHFSNVIYTKTVPCSLLRLLTTSTLSFIWLETNGNVSSPRGPVSPIGLFFMGSGFFFQVQSPGPGPVFRWYLKKTALKTQKKFSKSQKIFFEIIQFNLLTLKEAWLFEGIFCFCGKGQVDLLPLHYKNN